LGKNNRDRERESEREREREREREESRRRVGVGGGEPYSTNSPYQSSQCSSCFIDEKKTK